MNIRTCRPSQQFLGPLALIALLGLAACGGGGGGGDSGGSGSNPDDDSPLARTDDHPAYAVNVLDDSNGDSVIAVNSEVGEAAYLIHEGASHGPDSLQGIVYQSPDGSAARILLNDDGLPARLETEQAELIYSDYTARTVTVTVNWSDGRQQVFRNMPIESLLAARRYYKLDRQDIGFIIGFAGTAASVAFCVLPAATGVGTLITVGCANALLGTVGTILGDGDIGAGSSAIDLISGFYSGDYGSVATGLSGAVSGLLGWETELQALQITLAGSAIDGSSSSPLTVDGDVAEAYAIVSPKAGTGSERRIKLQPNGGFQVPQLLSEGAYGIRFEANGYITERYTLAVSGDRARVALEAATPDESDNVIYDVTYNDISRPGVIYLSAELDRAPKIYGKVVWPRRDAQLSEVFEIVDGGMVGLYDDQGNKLAFHTVDFVETASTVHGGEQVSGGDYELFLPEKHGTYFLEYSGAHWEKQQVTILTDRANVVRVDVPETGHQRANTRYFAYSPDSNVSTDVPVKSRYDGQWLATLTPSIATYTYTDEYQNAEGETVSTTYTEECEPSAALITLDGGAGDAELGGDTQTVAIGQKGEFAGESWVLGWDGFIYNGGNYWEYGGGEDEVGCYGTYTTTRR